MEKIKIILFVIVLFLFSCKNKPILDDDIQVPNVVTIDSTLIWKIPLNKDTIDGSSIHPIFWNEQIITSSNTTWAQSGFVPREIGKK